MTCGIRFPRSCCRHAALKRHGPEPERRSQKPAEVIHRAATRMNRLIQDLLDVALMEAGQLTIERARLSARELIVEAVEMQRPLASSSSLELRVDVDRDVPEVWGDRDRLLQVFENLIGNAIKFTKAGGEQYVVFLGFSIASCGDARGCVRSSISITSWNKTIGA